jgi:hypothetical protein
MENQDQDLTKKYKAFISYSHSDNQGEGRKWADWLHHALETYEIPTPIPSPVMLNVRSVAPTPSGVTASWST